MFVNPMSTMGMNMSLSAILGTEANRDIIRNINMDFNNGRSVIFGDNDPSVTHFRDFCNQILLPCREAAVGVMNTIRRIATSAPVVNYIPITSYEQFINVPYPMVEPLIFAPYAKELFLAGKIDGWGIPTDYVQNNEDVWGRLIDNGSVEFIQNNTQPNYLNYHFKSNDPNYEITELDAVDISRQYIDSFLKKEMGKGGEMRDPTSIGNTIIK